MNINEIISEVEKTNQELANQIRKYAKTHSYGLVFERNLPDAIRLYKKTPCKGDVVNILPQRGAVESDENKKQWTVLDVNNDIATLIHEKETVNISIEELVVVVSYHDVIYPGLKVIDKIERGNPDDPYHVLINAENYHALEALSYAYAGKVDVIYIDPPYNTGAKDWKYNNDYIGSDDQYRHSKWLTFMERRLKLAKHLLKPENSVMIITIDEKEYLRLGILLEQMFPEAKIQMISSVINPAGVSRDGEFARTNEFIFILRFGISTATKLSLSKEWNLGSGKGKASQGKIRWNSLCRTGTDALRKDSKNGFYPIYVSDDGTKIVKIGAPIGIEVDRNSVDCIPGCLTIWPIRSNGEEGRWQVSPETLSELVEKGYVKLGRITKHGMSISYLKRGEQEKVENGSYAVKGYERDGSVIVDDSDNEPMFTPGSIWNITSHDATQFGTKVNNALMPDRKFPFPKSVYAVEDCLRFFIADKPNALIVDFFAGSGTTAHATMLLNHLDGGHRRCISVTNNEVSAEEQKSFLERGLRPGDAEWEAKGIANYITLPRIKAAITGINTIGEPIKGDYKFTEEFPMSDGFKENAVFCELTYESAWPIRLDRSFNAIAPILWMQAGCKGKVIEKIGKAYRYTDNYAVLFDFKQASGFVKTVKEHPSIKTVYVVTDDQRRYSNICKRLSGTGVEVHRLYESYLKTFEIYGEGYYD